MNWRGLHISKPARLSIRQRQLLIEQEEGQHTLPMEDIAFIILDTQQVSLTAALLASCAGNGCLVVCCDAKHMPNGALLPYQQFHRHTETLIAQIALTEARKKQLWKSLVQRKIRNQAESLSRTGGTQDDVRRIAVLEAKVKNGDPENVEGTAAQLYWKSWVQGFMREQEGEDRLNAMLNYGYALLRAAIARELAGRGFSPSLGVHHRSMANAFNLADDLIEPWRPFVDELALKLWRAGSPEKDFSVEDRRALARIFYEPVLLEQESMQLLDAIKKQAEQFRAYALKTRNDIPLPTFAQDKQGADDA